MRVPDGVGWTAIGTSIGRAAESRRPDRLFADPLAEVLVSLLPASVTEPALLAATDPVAPEAGDGPGAMGTGSLLRMMPGRTHYFDVKVLQASAAGCGQVVILAAGLDSRAYRLPWAPGTRVFLLDTADVTAFRRFVAAAAGLRPVARTVDVVADLTGDWPDLLLSEGFDPAAKTVWVAEGILGYLTMGQAERLLSGAARLSGAGSWFLTQYLDAKGEALLAAQRGSRDAAASRVAGQRSSSELQGISPGEWLPRNGWDPETTTLSSWARQHGREVPAAADENRGGGRMWLVTARRRPAGQPGPIGSSAAAA